MKKETNLNAQEKRMVAAMKETIQLAAFCFAIVDIILILSFIVAAILIIIFS